MERPTCGTCPYWQACEQCGDGEAGGTCRRHPPSPPTSLGKSEIAKTADGAYRYDSHWSECAIWPHVDRVDWCGEHPDFPAWIATRKGEESEPPAGTPLSDLFPRLSTQSYGRLRRAGIDTIEALSAMSADELLSLPRIGRLSIQTVRDLLAERGLKLRLD
jgi:DNA-directed RNA polymerase alpha subunit